VAGAIRQRRQLIALLTDVRTLPPRHGQRGEPAAVALW
jgi:hypothetical protein